MSKTVTAITSIIIYPAAYLLVRLGAAFITQHFFFAALPVLFSVRNIPFTYADLILFGYGFFLFIHGRLNMQSITAENHNVRDRKTREPKKLLTTGMYKKVRHPMYGTFIILYISIFFPSRCIWGIIIPAAFCGIQVINYKLEEKRLIARFGNTYTDYKKETRKALFGTTYRIYIAAAVILFAAGIVLK